MFSSTPENGKQIKVAGPLNSVIARLTANQHEMDLVFNVNRSSFNYQNEQKVTSYYKNKLKQLYGVATTDATSESDILRKALKTIYDIKELKNQRSLTDRPKPVS